MKTELQEILNRINSLSTHSPDTFPEYLRLVKQCRDLISGFQADGKNPMLMAWINIGLEEISKELQNRLDKFLSFEPEKQKTEFMYSRSTVSLAITNIIMNL